MLGSLFKNYVLKFVYGFAGTLAAFFTGAADVAPDPAGGEALAWFWHSVVVGLFTGLAGTLKRFVDKRPLKR